MGWFGRGPGETYVDRKRAGWVGRFAGTVTEQYVPYAMPQEHGNKTELRWIEAMSAQTEDFEEYRRTDLRFHIGLAEAAGSPRLIAAMTDVQGQMTDLIALIPHPPEVLARSNEGHAKIVKALRREDGPRAVGLIREHTEGTEHILAGLLPARAQDLIRSPA